MRGSLSIKKEVNYHRKMRNQQIVNTKIKNRALKSLVNIVLIGVLCFMFTELYASPRSKALVVSKNGEAKYVFLESQLIKIYLTDGKELSGLMKFKSDSSILVGDEVVNLNQIYSMQVSKSNRAAKRLGALGLVGGTGLMIYGGSMMRLEGLVGMVSALSGFGIIMVGVVVDAVSLIAITIGSGRWINVEHDNYSLSIT